MINFSEIFDYPIYEVGGCVRDSLLGVPVKDVDIASNLPPEDFKKLCHKLKFRTHDTGIEHGTITVIIDGIPYEHTTFRKDVSCDGRNATIEYSDTIEEDLSRRDFTINAIAKIGNELIDPFGGQQDLINKKLRTVGNAEERFSEDFLRIVRAARFISRLDLEADKELLTAAVKLSPQIPTHVSVERITDEIKKAQKHGKRFFEEAHTLGFLEVIFKETLEMDGNARESWLSDIKNAENLNELNYFASILIPVYGNKAGEKAADLRLSRHISKGVDVLFEFQDAFSKVPKPAELRKLKLSVKEYYQDLKDYCSIVKDDPKSTANIKMISDLEPQVDESISSPFITGAFLIKYGLKPSPLFKLILEKCGNLQAEGASKSIIEQEALKLIDSKD